MVKTTEVHRVLAALQELVLLTAADDRVGPWLRDLAGRVGATEEWPADVRQELGLWIEENASPLAARLRERLDETPPFRAVEIRMLLRALYTVLGYRDACPMMAGELVAIMTRFREPRAPGDAARQLDVLRDWVVEHVPSIADGLRRVFARPDESGGAR